MSDHVGVVVEAGSGNFPDALEVDYGLGDWCTPCGSIGGFMEKAMKLIDLERSGGGRGL